MVSPCQNFELIGMSSALSEKSNQVSHSVRAPVLLLLHDETTIAYNMERRPVIVFAC
ncbi:hypothetical protein PI124_g21515 [Phytophthora idaei]|nr:hypothetical protein PI125_g23197 [Phytophthora idaei]KAG3131676.1 hypothetical protein PI126_g19958 [Phytophthora idaei]KAG3233412.1 hypothetical protein PI124_g21515 [Phytophthora idaei]